MKVQLSAEELNAYCLIYCNTVFEETPPLHMLYKMFPNGVKNKLKWKNKWGFDKLWKETTEKFDKEGLGENEDFLNAMEVLLLSEKAVYVDDTYELGGEGKRLYNFYKRKFETGKEGYVSLKFLEGERYELCLYENREEWLAVMSEFV